MCVGSGLGLGLGLVRVKLDALQSLHSAADTNPNPNLSPNPNPDPEVGSQVLWRAVEKAIPDVRKRVEVEMVGTPLTQARFLRRDRGTYGGYGWVGNGACALTQVCPRIASHGLCIDPSQPLPQPCRHQPYHSSYLETIPRTRGATQGCLG